MHASSGCTRPHAVAVAASHRSCANIAIHLFPAIQVFFAVYVVFARGGWPSSHKLRARTPHTRLTPSAAPQICEVLLLRTYYRADLGRADMMTNKVYNYISQSGCVKRKGHRRPIRRGPTAYRSGPRMKLEAPSLPVSLLAQYIRHRVCTNLPPETRKGRGPQPRAILTSYVLYMDPSLPCVSVVS